MRLSPRTILVERTSLIWGTLLTPLLTTTRLPSNRSSMVHWEEGAGVVVCQLMPTLYSSALYIVYSLYNTHRYISTAK